MTYWDDYIDRPWARGTSEGYKPFESVKRRPGPETREIDGGTVLSWAVFNKAVKGIDEQLAKMLLSIDVDTVIGSRGPVGATRRALYHDIDMLPYIGPIDFAPIVFAPPGMGRIKQIGLKRHTREEKKMKETSETFKVWARGVDYNTAISGTCRAVVRFEDMRGELSDMRLAISRELATEIYGIAGLCGAEVEITIKVRRPEKPLEEVTRLEKERGVACALVRAKELLK